ncbi:MAG: tetratricopeptide repeat protein [Alphaproteobacteria bacterium]
MRPAANQTRTAAQLAQAETLSRAGKLSEALEVLERARNADPLDARVLLELARIAGRLSLPDAAERCAAAALELDPDNGEILVERSNALRAQGRHEDAIALLRARLTENPARPELWLALSNTVHETGLLGEAETFAQESLRLKPSSAAARANFAGLLFDRGEMESALKEYDRAIKAAPQNAQIRFNRALTLLYAGDLKTGWREYEWRSKVPSREIERLFPGTRPKPWTGERRNGKSLLVMTEQGLGDQIMFASLIPDLIAQADGPILMDCEPRLVPLFARSFPGVFVHGAEPKTHEGRVQIAYDWLKDHGAELEIELGSLPRHLRATRESFPAQHVPLEPDAEQATSWRDWLASLGTGPKIGICWRSGKGGGLRNIQYAPLEFWARFAAETQGEIIVAQYDLTDDELAKLRAMSGREIHVPPGLDQRREIDRLAALLSELDVVVSAPTVVPVLSASVGTPSFKLTHAGSWTALGTPREAFLPAGRIIRPQQAGDWAEAFAIARRELDPLLHAK